MNEVFDAADAELDWAALPPEQCPHGSISTGVVGLAETGFAQVGIWQHPAGTSTDVEQDEVFVVISGRGRVHLADGRVLDLAPGIVGVLAAGTATTWVIDEPLRNVWLTAR